MRENTAALLVTRIQTGLIELILQPNTRDLWRLPQVDVRDAARGQSQILEWVAAALPWSRFAKLAEIKDSLAPERTVYLFHIHDFEPADPPQPFAWFNIQELPALAFMNETRLFDERTREITEIIIAHQNPYNLTPGFR